MVPRAEAEAAALRESLFGHELVVGLGRLLGRFRPLASDLRRSRAAPDG